MKQTSIIYFLIVTLLLVVEPEASGLGFSKEKNENNDEFAYRIAPEQSELVGKVISIPWNGKPVIIAFYKESYRLPIKDDPDQQEYFRLLGFVYFKSQGGNYTRYLIDTIDTEGDTPAIESVFFANADTDVAKELILIVSWEQRHAAVNGTLYGTFVYDDIATVSNKGKLRFMETISKKVDGGCDCTWDNGKTNAVKYKTAGAIKSELKRLGY
jgi:hypothetical protein